MKKQTAALARVPRQDSLDQWATRITSALQKTVEGIFETGRQLLAAREALEHGQWQRLFSDRRVPMSVQAARRFIEIYKRREVLLPKRNSCFGLPPSWTTLYHLARLPDDTLAWAHEHDKITPDLEGKQIAHIKAEYEGAPVTTPKATARYQLDHFGVRTPGSRLVTAIERQLNQSFDRLTTEDREYVIAMLRQTLEGLASSKELQSDGHHTVTALSEIDPT
jgi:hypothetical protein